MSKIAVIIVTFNGENYIGKCLRSVLASTLDCSVFVVDNASTDNTLKIVSEIEHIDITRNNANLGFGKANNVGIKKALAEGFDYFFLLNQDTYIDKNAIENLIKTMNETVRYGILSPMHLCGNEKDLDKNFEKYFESGKKTSSNVVDVLFVNAAAWLVSRKCFEKIGLFEPIFDHYGEDRNFCDRATYHGFDIGIVKNATIIHDRTIVRKFEKDVLQSKYLILNTFININLSILQRRHLGLKQVFGLTKYFLKCYSKFQTVKLFFELLFFYGGYLINFTKTSAIILQSKAGKNGL